MKNIIKLTRVTLIVFLLFVRIEQASGHIKPEVLDKATKAIVTISSRISVAAYKQAGRWTGTGFIADKKNGLVVTNNHVSGGASIGSYFVTFYNGQQSEAKVVYYDIWQDYAILKIKPEEVPASSEQIIFSKDAARQNQSVLVVGNTEDQGFSFHTGFISSLYEINGEMPQCSYTINLNTAGGASGSPVLNEKNEAVGVLYGGGKTYALALHGNYVSRTLEALQSGKLPSRNHIGIITEVYSLDKAVKHRNFPPEEMHRFIKDYPDARNKVVAVQSIISGSEAGRVLKAGDIIWEIEGKPVGGSLAIIDFVMDDSKRDRVSLVIYRDGKKMDVEVPIYSINSNKITKMINFGGATFFESDDYSSTKSGSPLRSLVVFNVQTGSSFSSIPLSWMYEDKTYYRIKINSIDGHNINNLEDLIKVIPKSIEKQFISVRFTNYQPYFPFFQGPLVSSQHDIVTDITLDSIETKPRILKYNRDNLEWVTEEINPLWGNKP